jgi:hypothetical protein
MLKGTVDECGPALVDVFHAFPDNRRLVQEHLIRHEGVEYAGASIEHG